MQSDGRESLAEGGGGEQPVRLTGRRPTLERIRGEAEEASNRRRRRTLITRVASAVVVVALAVLAYGLFAP
jgi:cytochrome c-type biogenesis protein CcmH/NrfG